LKNKEIPEEKEGLDHILSREGERKHGGLKNANIEKV